MNTKKAKIPLRPKILESSKTQEDIVPTVLTLKQGLLIYVFQLPNKQLMVQGCLNEAGEKS